MKIITNLYKKILQNKAYKQLVLSLLFNVFAKSPGILSIFFILPMISDALGSEMYGKLLAAIGLGASLCFPFDGIKTVARRDLAKAYGAKNKSEQANIFVTATLSIFFLSIIFLVVVGGISFNSWASKVLVLIAILPVISAFLNTFDSMRASFNEHYITANFQLIAQVVIYGLVIIFGIPKGYALLSGIIMHPYAIASLATMLFLLYQRKYLLSGKIKGLFLLFKTSLAVILSAGILSSIMGFTIYFLSQAASADYSAWIGTIYRLFMTFSSPFMLILFPLTSFISIHWESLSNKRKHMMLRLFASSGIGFGILVGLLIAIIGPFYVDAMFDLPVKGNLWDLLSLSIFLGAIIAQKVYSMLLYSFCEGLFISYSSIGAITLGFVCAAISYFWLPLKDTVNIMFCTIGFIIPIIILYENYRQERILTNQG